MLVEKTIFLIWALDVMRLLRDTTVTIVDNKSKETACFHRNWRYENINYTNSRVELVNTMSGRTHFFCLAGGGAHTGAL